jgi:Protein of unknown function (DUF3575)
MKKYILFLFLGQVLFATAQQRDNIIKLDVIQPIFSTFGLSYERVLPNDWSVQLHGSYTYRDITIWESLQPKFTGFAAELQARRYFPAANRDLPTGVFAGAYGKYAQYQMNMVIPAGKINFLDGNSKIFGVLLGYQHGFWENRFCVEVCLGGGYHIADYKGKLSERGRIIPSIISNGILPKIDLKIGIAF